MALLNEADLKLNIIANDEAGSTLQSLTDLVNTLKESMATLADENPFSAMQDSASTLVTSIKDMQDGLNALADHNPFGNMADQATSAATAVTDIFQQRLSSLDAINPFANMAADAESAAVNATDQFRQQLSTLDSINPFVGFQAMATESATQVTDEFYSAFANMQLPSPFDRLIQDARETSGIIIDDMEAAFKTITVPNVFAEWQTSLDGVQSMMAEMVIEAQQIRDSMTGVGTNGSGIAAGESSSGGKGLLESIGSLPNKALYTGMNMMMVGYGVNALVNSANNFSNIEQMMNLNKLTQQPNVAAQYLAMLGTSGMSGSESTSFLSTFSSNLMQQMTAVNGSGLSKTGLLLEQMGIGPSIKTLSPFQMLNSVGSAYRNLISGGRATQASELLGMTGTSQMANLFMNWSALQKQFSGLNLGMSPVQVKTQATKAVSLQASMQELSLGFSELAANLVPVINPLIQGMDNLLNTINNWVETLNPKNNSTTTTAYQAYAKQTKTQGSTPLSQAQWTKEITQGVPLDQSAKTAWSLGAFLQSLFHGIDTSLAGLFGGQKAYAATIPGATTSSELYKNSVAPNLDTWGPKLQTWSKGLYPEFSKGVVDWYPSIQGWSKGLYPKFSEGVNPWYDSILGWSKGLYPKFSEGVNPWYGNLDTWSKGLYPKIGPNLKLWNGDLASWSADLYKAVKPNLDTFTADLKSWSTYIASLRPTTVSNAVTKPPASLQTGTLSAPNLYNLNPPTSISGGTLSAPSLPAASISTTATSNRSVTNNISAPITINANGATAQDAAGLARDFADRMANAMSVRMGLDPSY